MSESYKYFTSNDRIVSSQPLETTVSMSLAANYNTLIRPTGSGNEHKPFYIYGKDSIEKVGISYGNVSGSGVTGSVYRQYAHTLLGYDGNGELRKFSEIVAGGNSFYFYSFPRSITKDAISSSPSGSFKLKKGGDVYTDSGSLTECQTGYYRTLTGNNTNVSGALFYEAGIAVITASAISSPASTMSASCSGAIAATTALSMSAMTELNSTIYFCRAYNNEFNYSANPTYLNDSEIVVKLGDPQRNTVSYITTVGLYDANEQLLAVAKLSEPIKKDPTTELIARVRLDF
jgi:hypothetical protein